MLGICSEAVEKEGCGRPQDGAHQAAGETRCRKMMEEELFESAAFTRRSRAHRRATAYAPGGPGLVTERCGVDSSQVERGGEAHIIKDSDARLKSSGCILKPCRGVSVLVPSCEPQN